MYVGLLRLLEKNARNGRKYCKIKEYKREWRFYVVNQNQKSYI